ncbi:MAG TPA: [LysW]-lysine hydrolase [Anaerolineales bacterium]|nr:[LysW]-lysine hydrolase [Anaerolineales bacterium]
MNEFETLIGLVSHYSPSGRERRAAEWLVAHMKSLGYKDAFIDEAGNAVGLMGIGPRQVVLLGHVDTVPGEINVHQDDVALYGRGTVDAKGPLASFTDAVARVGVMEGWQFVVIGAVEEERDSEGARYLAARYQPDYAIIGEPNQWDRIALGYKGSAWAEIKIRRSQAHTASGAETAPEAAIALWLNIKAYVETLNSDRRKAFDQLLLTLRSMDSASNDFEQWAHMRIGVRLPPDVSPDAWYENLEVLAGDAQVRRLGYAVPAWAGEKNNRLVRALLSGIRSQGGEPRFVYKTGTCDLNIVAPIWKCPGLVYGPGDSALDHTPNEHILFCDYFKAVAVLANALQLLVKSHMQ